LALPPEERATGERDPAQLNRQRLARTTNLPIDWQQQREMLGFG
jgi:hypothetical protein